MGVQQRAQPLQQIATFKWFYFNSESFLIQLFEGFIDY